MYRKLILSASSSTILALTLAAGAAQASTGNEIHADYGYILPSDGGLVADYGYILPSGGSIATNYGYILPSDDPGARYGYILPSEGAVGSDYGYILPSDGRVSDMYGYILPSEGAVWQNYGYILPSSGEVGAEYGYILPSGDVGSAYGYILPSAGSATAAYGYILPSNIDVSAAYGYILPSGGALGDAYGYILPSSGGVDASYGYILPSANSELAGGTGFMVTPANSAVPAYGYILPSSGDLSQAYGYILPSNGQVYGSYGYILPSSGEADPTYGYILPSDDVSNGGYGFITPSSGDIAGRYGYILPSADGKLFGTYGYILPSDGTVESDYGYILPSVGTIIPDYGYILPSVGTLDPTYGYILPSAGGSIVADYGYILPSGVQGAYGYILPSQGSNSPTTYGSLLPSIGQLLPDYGYILPSDQAGLRSSFGFVMPDYGYILPSYGYILPSAEGWELVEGDVTADYGYILPSGSGAAPYYGFIIPTELTKKLFPTMQPVAGPNLVDHWMAGARYSPIVSAAAGAGEGVTVGLLDFSVAETGDVADAVTWKGGITDYFAPHGTGVASLIVGGRNGFGINGIAQRADLAVFNPYDDSESTNFDDSATGILALAAQGASVVNMSLGVENYVLSPDWNEAFGTQAFKQATSKLVLVKAAGNDGVAQAENVEWTGNVDNLILVGSVDIDGAVSDFSNTPGSACFTTSGACTTALKDRFLVAPGMQITVSDGQGGFLTASGTSVAAPLVTGAVALLQSRWPWLKKDAAASTEIIFRSARDMGDPGVDDQYGHGLLDIAASQRPLPGSVLTVSPYAKAATMVSMRQANVDIGPRLRLWQPTGGTQTVFEKVGSTYRDFVMPLTLTALSQVAAGNGTQDAFEATFADFTGPRNFAPTVGGADEERSIFGFSSIDASRTLRTSGLKIGFAMAPTRSYLRQEGGANIDTAVSVEREGGAFSLTAGSGAGALALQGTDTFGFAEDFDLTTGGVNPLLGLASGGGFAGAKLSLAENLTLGFGATNRDFNVSRYSDLGARMRSGFMPLDAYKATAMTASATYTPRGWLTLSATATSLDEDNAVLGVQGLQGGFDAGSNTTATTLGVAAQLVGLTFEASATKATTNLGEGQALQLSGGRLGSSAYQVAVGRENLFSGSDRIRVSFAQPLHVDGGSVNYRGYEITDRATGAIGEVDSRLGIDSGPRLHVAEVTYGTNLLGGAAQVNAFSRGEFGLDKDLVGESDALTVGASFNLTF